MERLHRLMTVDELSAAAEALRGRGVALCVFLPVSPPLVQPDEQDALAAPVNRHRLLLRRRRCLAHSYTVRQWREEALTAEDFFRAHRLDGIDRGHEGGRIIVDLLDLK